MNLDGAPADAEVARRMTELQRHRGPDDHGLRLFSLSGGDSQEVRAGVRPARNGFDGALGFNRLKILDLTQCGHQPMVGVGGRVIAGATQGDAEKLWITVALELWAQQFLDGRAH